MKLLKILLLICCISLVWLAAGYMHHVISSPRPAPKGAPVRRASARRTSPRHERKTPNAGPAALAGSLSTLLVENTTPPAGTVAPRDSRPLPTPSPAPPLPPTPPVKKKKDGAGRVESSAAGDGADAPPDGEFSPPSPLAIVTAGLPGATLGADYYTPLFASGGTLPYAWRIASGSLPPGLVLQGRDAYISGAPLSAGTYAFSLTVADSAGSVAMNSYTLSVTEPEGLVIPRPAGVRTDPLYLTTGPLPGTSPGEPYRVQMDATGGRPPYAWSIDEGAPPAGIGLGPDSGLITGTASAVERAVFRVAVTDSDMNRDVAEYAIDVRGDDLVITTAGLAEGTTGEYYYDFLEASGGLPPYLWSLASGSLPEGLTLDAESGSISGTPGESGTRSITVAVTDAQAAAAASSFTITVHSPTLAIVTKSLPSATIGDEYSSPLDADGGAPPYAWSLSNGSLPSGLSLNGSTGVISGTPSTEAVASGFTASVTDTEGSIAQRALTIEVGEPAALAVESLSASPSDGKAGLTWKNPSADSYSRTAIVRNTVSSPSGIADGETVYEGTGTSFLDSGLVNGTTYYYAAFALDTDGNAGAVADESRAAVTPLAVSLTGTADPFADGVPSFQPLSSGGYGASQLPSIVLGPPRGSGSSSGSLDVLSLHARVNDDGGASPPYGGSVTLEFSDNLIVNGEGDDFIVFENAFYVGGDPENRWMEPAIVAVSRDGEQFVTFPFYFVPHYKNGEIDCQNPYCYSRGFAGITPVYSNSGTPDPRDPAVAGGDAFDLADVNLDWARYVRITSTGDNWLTADNGYSVRHITSMGSCSGAGASGFDLDAVGAINY